MANKELTALPTAGALTAASVLYLVDENNNSRKVSLADLAQWIKTAESIVPASNPWKGARVRRTANQTISSATISSITWQVADINTNAFWSAGAPTRLTVPANVTKVRLRGGVRFNSAASPSGTRQIFMTKNGVTFNGRGALNIPAEQNMTHELNVSSGVISVVVGDYFELAPYHTQGAALDVLTHESTWFEMEVVEGAL